MADMQRLKGLRAYLAGPIDNALLSTTAFLVHEVLLVHSISLPLVDVLDETVGCPCGSIIPRTVIYLLLFNFYFFG